MTRDEYREKCIDAIDEAIANNEHLSSRRHKARRVLDSLHGIVFLIPHGAMDISGIEVPAGSTTIRELFYSMAEANDLTNPPEGKP